MATVNRTVADLKYIEFLFVIVVGWLLVAIWQRCIDNVCYRSLGLNSESTFHTFVVSLTTTAIFLAFVFSFDSILGNLVEAQVSGNVPAPLVDSTKNLEQLAEILKNLRLRLKK